MLRMRGWMRPRPVLYIHSRSIHQLRPYQQECIDATLEAYKNGVYRQAVSLPVGSGKTVIFSHLIQRILKESLSSHQNKVLILAHRTELLQQAMKQIKRAHTLNMESEEGLIPSVPHLRIQLDQGAQVVDMHKADIFVASVNALGRSGSKRLERYDPSLFKLIIVDEAHHAAAATYERIFHHFQLWKHTNMELNTHNILLWGCSATLNRHDGKSLSGAFDKVVYRKDLMDMIQEKWLSDFTVFEANTSVNLDKLFQQGHPISSTGDFVVEKLSRVVNIPERNELIAETYIALKSQHKTETVIDPHPMRSTLVFAVDKNHIQSLVEAFQDRNIYAKGLSSDTDDKEREMILYEFQQGTLPVLINCGILTEGVDIPEIDVVFLARPTRSLGLLQQMIGRGLRRHSDKEKLLIVDFVDTLPRDKTSLARMATLLGLPPQPTGKSRYLIDTTRKGYYEPKILSRVRSFHEFSDIEFGLYDLKGWAADAAILKTWSRFSWVRIAPEDFGILLPDFQSILIRKKETQQEQVWEAYQRDFSSKHKKKPRLLATFDSPDAAIRGMDTWISKKYSHLLQKEGFSNMFVRSSKWRSSPHILAKQRAYLFKLLHQAHEKGQLNEPVDDIMKRMTRGAVTDFIMRARTGGIAAYDQQVQQKARLEKQEQKQNRL